MPPMTTKPRMFRAIALALLLALVCVIPADARFQVNQLIGFGAGGSSAAVTFSFTASVVVEAPASSTVTFSAVSLGTASTTRKIVVGVAKGGGSADSITSVEVGGVSATLVIASGGGSSAYTELWQAAVSTGTSGDIVVVFSGTTPGRAGIGVYAVYDAASAAYDTGNSSADPSTDTINVPANGVLIGCAIQVSGGTFTWTNLTEKYDESFGVSSTQSGAADTFAAAETARSITADGAAAGDSRMVLGSWAKL